MSERSLTLRYAQDDASVRIAMTGAAFETAAHEEVVAIGPDVSAMAEIAYTVGAEKALAASGLLLPHLVVVRNADHLQRNALPGSGWDTRLPQHAGQPHRQRYFAAEDIAAEYPRTGGRDALVVVAKGIGARHLTEVSIRGWKKDDVSRRERAAAFVEGLLLNQRLLDLPDAPSGLGGLVRPWIGSLRDGSKAKKVHAVRAGKIKLPDPFRLKYRTNHPSKG